MTPRFSIVVVTYGKREVTERCLETIDEAFGPRLGHEVELVLVDNDSPDDTAELLRSWEHRATVVLLPENLNYSGGNNVGARAASGDVLVLLNNDTEVAPGALDELAVQALEPGVGIAGCRLLYPDGAIQHGGCVWWRGPDEVMRTFHLFHLEPGDLPPACASFDGDFVTGACIAIRRELYLELGGFDEAYENGWEDVDLCVRARLAGQRVVYRGDIAIVHREGATRTRSPNESANHGLFLARYGDMLDDDSERLEQQLDATGPHLGVAPYPGDHPHGSELSVEGDVAGLAEESAEARALLAILEAAELEPASREWKTTSVMPRLSDAEWAPLARARERSKRHDALVVQAPVGRLGTLDPQPRSILRLAAVPDADVSGVAAVWAASPAVADELVAGGVDPERVSVVAPFVPELPLGGGGQGVLALLPAHDAGHCASLLAALAELPPSAPVRLLPSFATEPLAALAESLLPAAELLQPVASELRFAALAADCDVVVCADPRAPFERRALIAAAVGAAPVGLSDGSAASVLGDELASMDGDWGAALERALGAAARRELRAQAIRRTCGQDALAPRLRALVQAAAQEPAAEIALFSALASASGARPLSM